jgi:hypothetical protein
MSALEITHKLMAKFIRAGVFESVLKS